MAKIQTYPLDSTPSFSDMLIGTDVNGPILNATKNFSLQKLYDLFATVPITGTLQTVLNAGNTATQNIFLSGNITSITIKPEYIIDLNSSSGTVGQILKRASTGIQWVDATAATSPLTTKGDLYTFNTTNTRLPVGTNGQTLIADSTQATGLRWGVPVAQTVGLYAQTALSTPIVYASGEASLIGTGVGTLTVPANGFSVGDSFTVKMCGRFTCANNEILHIHVRSNGVTILDGLQFTLAAVTNKYWDLVLDFTVTKLGVAGVAELFGNGIFTYNKNAATAIEGTHFGQIDNTLFNTTVSNTIDITAQWVTNNALNTIRSQNFVLTRVY